MAQQTVNTGDDPDDGNGTIWRTAWDFVNNNFIQLFAALLDNVVIIKSETDLPTGVTIGGVLSTRLEEREYVFNGSQSLVRPLAPPGAGKTATIRATNRSAVTNTGGIAMFRDTDAEGNIELEGLTEFRCPGGKIWDLTAVSGVFSFQASGGAHKFTDCESLGVLNCNGTSGFNLFFGTLSNFNQGLVVNDSTFLEINSMFVFGNNAVGCVYFTVQGASTVGSVNFDTMTVGSGLNETLFSLNSNIQSGVDSINMHHNTQEGGINGTIFAPGSLTEKSNKVLSVGNSILGDSIPGGLLSLSNNAAVTTITASSSDGTNAVLVAGTWVVQDESQFTGTTLGRLTYNDARDITVNIEVVASVDPVGDATLGLYIAKNGTAINETGIPRFVKAADAGVMSTIWKLDLVTTDFIEIFIENQSGTENVLLSDIIFRIP